MKIVMFYHSLVSDWNHGNAHFLRGVASELLARGHDVNVFEPRDGWSLTNLLSQHGKGPVSRFRRAYPLLHSSFYEPETLELDEVLNGADLVLVHEWNEAALVARIGRHHESTGDYRLFFHDTHHRLVTDPESMARFDLSGYDGVLAYGEVLKDLYERTGRVRRAWTWHEAADTRTFHPLPATEREGDIVWIGNWGDGERTAELNEYLFEPTSELKAKNRVYGVRYPEEAQVALAKAGIEYAGWLPNFEVPGVFSRFKATVHVPRRPYVEALPGIPTIRPFEALACGIPLISSPWSDAENLFSPGRDYLVARNGREMATHMRDLLHDDSMAEKLAQHGLETIRSRHTCGHRVDQLLSIEAEVRGTAEAVALRL